MESIKRRGKRLGVCRRRKGGGAAEEWWEGQAK